MSLHVNKQIENTSLLLVLEGILDISTSGVIEQCLENVKGINELIFDFSKLHFIDSTGIGSIINALYLSQEQNFKIVFRGINELTNEVFETVGLYKIIEAMQGEVA